jgi:hypothetical protein
MQANTSTATRSHRVRRAVIIGVGSVGLALGAAATIAPTASAAVILGGVDIAKQCRPLETRLLDAHNAFSWRCYSSRTGNYYSVNLDAACADQYGPGAFAVVLNTSDPYSWRCAR